MAAFFSTTPFSFTRLSTFSRSKERPPKPQFLWLKSGSTNSLSGISRTTTSASREGWGTHEVILRVHGAPVGDGVDVDERVLDPESRGFTHRDFDPYHGPFAGVMR